MYLKLFLASFERKLGGGKNGGVFRSITVTGFIIVLLIVGAAAAYIEHGRGNISKLKRHLKTPVHADPNALQPGGQDPVILTRTRAAGDASQPEFLSATLLPGRGLNVLQIKAFIPGLGEVNLLSAPELPDAARAMSGVEEDSEGQASLIDGAPFLVPWAGHLSGVASIDGKSASVLWKNSVLNLPANSVESTAPSAYGGLLLSEPSVSVKTDSEPDGGTVRAVYSEADDQWPSSPESTITVRLTGHAVEMTVDLKNAGDTPTPVGIGWAPRFLIQGGDRSKATLHIPTSMHAEVRDVKTGLPNGIIHSVTGTPLDFSSRDGASIGDLSLEDTFVHLRPEAGIELRDPVARFGLRLIPLSASIKAVHVFSPTGSNFVSISPQTNYDDPFGREWAETEDTGMALLAPGQSVQWRIRLELFALPGTK